MSSEVQRIDDQLKALSENKDCIEWVLGQQANLRTELMAFFKKDIKEIDSAISDLNLGETAKEFSLKIVELVRDTFIKHWQQSFNLVSPELLSTTNLVSPEPLSTTTEE